MRPLSRAGPLGWGWKEPGVVGRREEGAGWQSSRDSADQASSQWVLKRCMVNSVCPFTLILFEGHQTAVGQGGSTLLSLLP